MVGAIDLYALDPDRGFGDLTFIGLFFMEGRQSSCYWDRQTIRDSFSLAITRACPVLCPPSSLPPFTTRRVGDLAPRDPFILSLWLGFHGNLNSIFVAVSAFDNAGFDNFGDSKYELPDRWLVEIRPCLCSDYYWRLGALWSGLTPSTKARNPIGRRTLRFHTKVFLWLTAAIFSLGS